MFLSLVTLIGIEVAFNTIIVSLRYRYFDNVYLFTRSAKILSLLLL